MSSGLVFFRRYVGAYTDETYITLQDWVNQCVPREYNNLLLQMDIEGAEYKVLAFEDLKLIKRFAILVIEFHALQNMQFMPFSEVLEAIFEKLYAHFVVVHAHPNNCCPSTQVGSVLIPNVLEVTFLRRDIITQQVLSKDYILPHRLDRPNISSKPDTRLSREWWDRNDSFSL
jgi:hypothetical protein